MFKHRNAMKKSDGYIDMIIEPKRTWAFFYVAKKPIKAEHLFSPITDPACHLRTTSLYYKGLR